MNTLESLRKIREEIWMVRKAGKVTPEMIDEEIRLHLERVEELTEKQRSKSRRYVTYRRKDEATI